MNDINSDCSYPNFSKLLTTQLKCDFAQKNCEGIFFNPYVIHYCSFNENYLLSIIFTVLFIVLLFYLLSETASKYLGVSLTILSSNLNISESISAMTLLAFGNGAGDIISSLVASNNIKSYSTNQLDLSLGALLGAGVIVTSFVTSSVIFFGSRASLNPISISPASYLREIICYLISLSMLVFFSFVGEINLLMASSLLIIYVINLIIAINLDQKEEEIINENEATCHNSGQIEIDSVSNTASSNNLVISQDNIIEQQAKLSFKIKFAKKFSVDSIKRNIPKFFIKLKISYFKDKKDFEELTFLGKLKYLTIHLPFDLIRDFSIPCVEKEKFNKHIFNLFPVFSVIAIITLFQIWNEFLNMKIWIIGVLSVLIILSSIILCYMDKETIFNYSTLFCLISFIMSVIWIWSFTNSLVNLLEFIGVILNVSPEFLGLTLLALGNSAPDISLNISLSKRNYAKLALSGSISGPVFNFLIGLGLSLILLNINKGPVKFDLFLLSNRTTLIAFLAIIINCIVIMIYGYIKKFNFDRGLSYILLFLFVSYTFIVGLFTFG